PVDVGDPVRGLVDVVRQAASDAAVRAHALDLLELLPGDDRRADRLVDEGARRAHRHALAAGDAGALSHGRVEIERDLRAVALAGAADHVVVLDLVAAADAPIAEDAGLVVDRDHLGARVLGPPVAARERRARLFVFSRERVELAVAGGRL